MTFPYISAKSLKINNMQIKNVFESEDGKNKLSSFWQSNPLFIILIVLSLTESQKLKHELFDNQFAQTVIPENTLFVLIRENF